MEDKFFFYQWKEAEGARLSLKENKQTKNEADTERSTPTLFEAPGPICSWSGCIPF